MRNLAIVGLTALLTACGGGDSGSTPSPAPAPTPAPVIAATAEGFWEGSASTGVAVALAVLETGETWGVYTSTNGTIVGALFGNTTSSGTTLTGSGQDFNIPTRSVSSSNYSGTFAAKNTINVTTSPGTTFSGTYRPAYDLPVSLTTASGTFAGTGVSGNSAVQPIGIAISPSGIITVPGTQGCSASGSATPRASGKNILNVIVKFSGANCALGDGASTTGIAYYDTIAQRLLVLALNASKSDGFIYIGQKQAPAR